MADMTVENLPDQAFMTHGQGGVGAEITHGVTTDKEARGWLLNHLKSVAGVSAAVAITMLLYFSSGLSPVDAISNKITVAAEPTPSGQKSDDRAGLDATNQYSTRESVKAPQTPIPAEISAIKTPPAPNVLPVAGERAGVEAGEVEKGVPLNKQSAVIDATTKPSLLAAKEIDSRLSGIRNILDKHNIKVMVVDSDSPLLLSTGSVGDEKAIIKAFGRAYLGSNGSPTGFPLAVVSAETGVGVAEHEVSHLLDFLYNPDIAEVVSPELQAKIPNYYWDLLNSGTKKLLSQNTDGMDVERVRSGPDETLGKYKTAVNSIGAEHFDLFVESLPPDLKVKLGLNNGAIDNRMLIRWYESGGSENHGTGLGEQALVWFLDNNVNGPLFSTEQFGAFLLTNYNTIKVDEKTRAAITGTILNQAGVFRSELFPEALRGYIFEDGKGVDEAFVSLLREYMDDLER